VSTVATGASTTGSERKKSAPAIPPIVTQQPPSAEASSDEEEGEEEDDDEDENDAIGTGVDLSANQGGSAQRSRSQSIQMAQKAKFGSKGALHSPVGSAHSFDLQVSRTRSPWFFVQFPFYLDVNFVCLLWEWKFLLVPCFLYTYLPLYFVCYLIT